MDELSITQGALPTELSASWVKQTRTPCPVDNYIIEYQLLNQDQCQQDGLPDRTTYGTVDNTEVTLEQLIPYSTYRVYVIAVNGAGKGNETSEIQMTSEIGEFSLLQEGQLFFYCH